MEYFVPVFQVLRYFGLIGSGVGIIGRWRDGTEPPGTGVTGPFWLWKSKMRPPLGVDSEDDEDSEVETPDILSQAADDGSWVDSSGEEDED